MGPVAARVFRVPNFSLRPGVAYTRARDISTPCGARVWCARLAMIRTGRIQEAGVGETPAPALSEGR